MDFPLALRHAVDERLAGVSLADLARSSCLLTERYRSEVRDGRRHLDSEDAALAYLAARLPATYAAVREAMRAVAESRPDFSPTRQLDAGAGPGTALWAAFDCWGGLTEAFAIENGETIRLHGEELARGLPVSVTWRAADLTGPFAVEGAPFDLTTLAYVLDELAPEMRASLVLRLWAATSDVLLIVEPGTPAGWERILAARAALIAEGAKVVAPCPHGEECPVRAPDWCHFSRRVARSKAHLRIKDAEVPWEDEKFAYLAVSRFPGRALQARVIATPRLGSGKVSLKLCLQNGAVEQRLVSKRDAAAFKVARRSSWGERFEVPRSDAET